MNLVFINFSDLFIFTSDYNFCIYYDIRYKLNNTNVILHRESKHMCFNVFLYEKTHVSYIFHMKQTQRFIL
jgi:hypothetical protein